MTNKKYQTQTKDIYNVENKFEAMRAESARKHEELIDLLKKFAISIGCAKEVEEWEKPEEHLMVSCLDEEIVKFPTQHATTEISGEDGSNLEEFLDVLIVEEANITRPIMAVEDEHLMVLGSVLDIIKEDFSNDLDGQHSADESKPYHNTLRWHIMRLKRWYVISHEQICTNVLLRQELVCAQRRTCDPGITCLEILKRYLEDKVFLHGGVMIRFQGF
ncbi:hypothetical protein Tco_0682024 [Tanacetum coccineum]|uniref:Uncharacterized protein n=1 Tax=Tanacetum coccineum TaxID=301880 RepID=A0ABQ4XR51_9ASTR